MAALEIEVADGVDSDRAPPEIEREARLYGWRPREEYKGTNPWVDAQEFVNRSRELQPYLQHSNSKLREENERLTRADRDRQTEIADLKRTVDSLKEFRAEIAKRQKEELRQQLLSEFAEARKTGDVEREAEILAQLPDRGEVEKPVTTAPPAAPPPQELQPEFKAFIERNPWTQDEGWRETSIGVFKRLEREGKTAGMNLTQKLEAVEREMTEKYLPREQSSRTVAVSRVEGGVRPAGATATDEGSFESLPLEIQRECDAQIKRLGLVGPRKAFPDVAAARKFYAKDYLAYG